MKKHFHEYFEELKLYGSRDHKLGQTLTVSIFTHNQLSDLVDYNDTKNCFTLNTKDKLIEIVINDRGKKVDHAIIIGSENDWDIVKMRGT